MIEEKEREKKSAEAARPSFDSLRAGDRSPERGSPNSPSRQGNKSPALNPVREGQDFIQPHPSNAEAFPDGKLEQFNGFTVDNPVLARAIGANLASAPVELPATPVKRPPAGVQSAEGTPDKYTPSTALPPVTRIASGFGDDFWRSSKLPEELQGAKVPQSPPTPVQEPASQTQAAQTAWSDPQLRAQPSLGLRTMVNTAFDRRDDRSVPPTPISRSVSQAEDLTNSDVSRSNTNSTAGISPIMSRVPSGATAEARMRAAEARETAVPPIAEEDSQPGSPASRRASAMMDPQQQHLPRISSPAHSRNSSAELTPAAFIPACGSGDRRDTSSPGNSPARTPVAVEASRRLSGPMAAETTSHPLSSHASKLNGLGLANIDTGRSDYTTREADLAQTLSANSDPSSPKVAEAVHDAQSNFLTTHSPATAVSPRPLFSPRASTPLSGRESPVHGRVRDLAGKFNEIDDGSRRNSAVSISSKSSWSSWGRGDDIQSLKRAQTGGSAVESPLKEDIVFPQYDNASPEEHSLRPDATRGTSFRPKLPGEWVSEAVIPTANRPASATEESDSGMHPGFAPAASYSSDIAKTAKHNDVELTPTTAKHQLESKDVGSSESDPVFAIRTAGEALGAAILASVGMGSQPEDTSYEPKGDKESRETDGKRPTVGDVFLRPLAYGRAESSVASSMPPSPPAKDTPSAKTAQRSSGYFPIETPLSESDALSPDEDLESDRLRREIENSLHLDDQDMSFEGGQDALNAPSNTAIIREAEAPATGLAGHSTSAHDATVRDANMSRSHAPDHVLSHALVDHRPESSDSRFSWENRSSAILSPATYDASKAPRSRPVSGLHVVNANISEESIESTRVPSPSQAATFSAINPQNEHDVERSLEVPAVAELAHGPVSPVGSFDAPHDSGDLYASNGPPSPITSSPHYDMLKPLPIPTDDLALPTPQSNDTSARLPPFREILAIRSAPERIMTFNSTRDQFASTDTGLRDWLHSTLNAHPEHAYLITESASPNLGSTATMGSIRHKPAESIIRIAKNFNPMSRGDGPMSPSADDRSPAAQRTPSTGYATMGLSPSQQGGGVEKMQARGKDLFHSAGAVSKGWLAKGKKKLRESGAGGDKVD